MQKSRLSTGAKIQLRPAFLYPEGFFLSRAKGFQRTLLSRKILAFQAMCLEDLLREKLNARILESSAIEALFLF